MIKLILLLISFLFINNVFATGESVRSDKLWHYYEFNNNINDSINNKNGEVSPWYSISYDLDRFENQNESMTWKIQFWSYTNPDWINAPFWCLQNNETLSFWFKPIWEDNWWVINRRNWVGDYNTRERGFELWDNNLNLYHWANYNIEYYNMQIDRTKWNHVAISIDNASFYRVYLNWSLKTTIQTTQGSCFYNNFLNIWWVSDDTYPDVNVLFDDLMYYNTELSLTDILTIYNSNYSKYWVNPPPASENWNNWEDENDVSFSITCDIDGNGSIWLTEYPSCFIIVFESITWKVGDTITNLWNFFQEFMNFGNFSTKKSFSFSDLFWIETASADFINDWINNAYENLENNQTWLYSFIAFIWWLMIFLLVFSGAVIIYLFTSKK